MNKMKIHCLEALKDNFCDLPYEDVIKMVGTHIKLDGGWEVTLVDGDTFECPNQETAEIIGSLEEIKAMLIQQSVDKKE